MSFWTLFKLIAALSVGAVMVFTGMLAYHVAVKPLGGIFEKLIPTAHTSPELPSGDALATMLEAADLPDIDPGEKAFQKAHDLLALGKLPEAREKLTAILATYPSSSSAPAARRIVGDMNLDEILSASQLPGKQIHVVKRGDSFLSIATKYRTTIECMMQLNAMMELKNIQPGEELVVMPLDFRLIIEPRRKALSLWEGERFIREYPVLSMPASLTANAQRSTINSKSAAWDGRRVLPQAKEFRAANKIIHVAKPALQIRAGDGSEEAPAGTIVLRSLDMEELHLLTRVGNEVEFR